MMKVSMKNGPLKVCYLDMILSWISGINGRVKLIEIDPTLAQKGHSKRDTSLCPRVAPVGDMGGAFAAAANPPFLPLELTSVLPEGAPEARAAPKDSGGGEICPVRAHFCQRGTVQGPWSDGAPKRRQPGSGPAAVGSGFPAPRSAAPAPFRQATSGNATAVVHRAVDGGLMATSWA